MKWKIDKNVLLNLIAGWGRLAVMVPCTSNLPISSLCMPFAGWRGHKIHRTLIDRAHWKKIDLCPLAILSNPALDEGCQELWSQVNRWKSLGIGANQYPIHVNEVSFIWNQASQHFFSPIMRVSLVLRLPISTILGNKHPFRLW